MMLGAFLILGSIYSQATCSTMGDSPTATMSGSGTSANIHSTSRNTTVEQRPWSQQVSVPLVAPVLSLQLLTAAV